MATAIPDSPWWPCEPCDGCRGVYATAVGRGGRGQPLLTGATRNDPVSADTGAPGANPLGHLVELPTKRPPVRAVEPGHSAAILFFTGVRYCRAEEGASPMPSAAIHRTRKRKVPPAELQA